MQPSKINFSQTDFVYFCSVVQMVLLRYITNDEISKFYAYSPYFVEMASTPISTSGQHPICLRFSYQVPTSETALSLPSGKKVGWKGKTFTSRNCNYK